MKYAHLADLHLGSWRDEKMRFLSTKAFLKAIDDCVARKVDFILFAGDLFNTSLPSLDVLKIVTEKLKQLKDVGIPIYVIAGSHDFSPSGKTMIDVLEKAGLLINVCKGNVNENKELELRFTVDLKTGAKITGMLGRKGQLDQTYYDNLHRESLEQEEGYKIFMFHTTVAELLPRDLSFIESLPISFFPKNFDYYAGGHIHHPMKVAYGRGVATYTGALFPGNFAEFEKFGKGGYYIVESNDGNNDSVMWVPLEVVKHHKVILPCNLKTPETVTFDLLNHFSGKDLTNTVVTIRLQGTLQNGKVSDINFNHIFERIYGQDAYFIMKNTAKLQSEEFEEVVISQTDPDKIEQEIIKEHLQQVKMFDVETEFNLTTALLTSLETVKKEGETNTDFNKRVENEITAILNYEK